ncbi:hypothetical protein [Methanospirillum sp.]
MSLSSLKKRLSVIEMTKKDEGDEWYTQIKYGLYQIGSRLGHDPLRTDMCNWISESEKSGDPFNVTLGGLYHRLSNNPEYLQISKLDALPEVIDDFSRNILREKYNINIPDRNHGN